jgi:ABC-type transport system substrate-binding protein
MTLISRRRVIGIGSLVAVNALLAACGPQSAATPTTAPTQAPTGSSAPVPSAASQASAAPAASTAGAGPPAASIQSGASLAGGGAPQPGGTFRILSNSDIRGLDPGSAEGSADWWASGYLLYSHLYFYDKDFKLYPDVAAEFPTLSADATTYTIPLRKGVKFHNGRELKAADAKFSLEWQLWKDVYSWGKSYGETIVGYQDVIDGKTKELSGVKVIDDYTIQVQLSKPQAVFPALLSYSMWGLIPKEETIAAGKDFGTKVVIGSGPFKFVSWERGQKVIFEKHKEYHRQPLPYVDRIEESLLIQPPTQLLQFEAGQADRIMNIPPAELGRILTDPKVADMLRVVKNSGVQRLLMNFKTKPFDNVKVRQAVAHAIDKDNLVKINSGTVSKAEGFYCSGMLQYDPNFKSQYQLDPAKAKQLLADAGFAGGIQGVKFWVGTDPSSPLGQAIQADLKNVGIQVEIITGQRKDIGPQMKAGDNGLSLSNWAASMWDAYDYVSAWSTAASAAIPESFNDGNYSNPKIDELLDQAERLPLTDDKRIQNYRQIEEIVINQDVAWVGMYQGLSVALSQPYVHNDWLSGLYASWPIAETTWMSKR